MILLRSLEDDFLVACNSRLFPTEYRSSLFSSLYRKLIILTLVSSPGHCSWTQGTTTPDRYQQKEV